MARHDPHIPRRVRAPRAVPEENKNEIQVQHCESTTVSDFSGRHGVTCHSSVSRSICYTYESRQHWIVLVQRVQRDSSNVQGEVS
jgi:hypothetical protein